ncbi:MAG: peroxiredoxin family protein [Gammaproteobacteria bacterium]
MADPRIVTTLGRRAVLTGAAAAVVAGAVPTVATGGERSERGILGQAAPELDVPFWIDASGEPASFTLASARGSWVFLKCFQAWCPGCHSSGFPTLKKVTDAFAEEPRVTPVGLQTVFEGFSTNTQDRVREMQLRYELPILMGHDAGDPDGIHLPVTMVNYRTGGTPWIIVINPQGLVVYNNFHIDAAKLIEYLKAQLV